MSCKDCEEAYLSGGIAYFRWGNANIGMLGCEKHLKEVFAALRKAQGSEEETEGWLENLERRLTTLEHKFEATRDLTNTLNDEYRRIKDEY